MRKSLLAVSALAVLTGLAAPPVFNVEAPKWDKIAVSTTDGLNVRKAPSTTAPKLMYDEMKIEDYETPVIYSAFWAVKPPTRTCVSITLGVPAPIVSERDGWYEVLNCGPKYESNGWVSAKFSKAVSPQPIEASKLSTYPSQGWIDRGADGLYLVSMNHNEMNGDVSFLIGRVVNGIVVCPYELYCPSIELDNSRKTGLYKKEGYIEFIFNKAEALDDYEYSPDITKFSKDLLEAVIEKAEPAQRTVYMLLYDNNFYQNP